MNTRAPAVIRLVAAGLGALTLVSCGGGGGSSTSSVAPTAVTATAVTGYLVDGPVLGITYACSPSGKSGITDGVGTFSCAAGDTATFTLAAGNGTINLGSVPMPATSGVSVPVTMLANGLQVAEILHALNHGSTNNMDVSGLQVSKAAVAAINAYIASGGTQLNGLASDDQFMAWVQQQTSGVSFTISVTGAGTTFRNNTVLPDLQATIVAISGTNPPPVSTNNTTKLSGTIVVSGGGALTGTLCPGSFTFSGGGILNATVGGNIQSPGTYAVNWTSPGFQEMETVTIQTCTPPGATQPIPGTSQTSTSTVPPFNGNGQMTVISALTGTTLAIPTAQAPAGCVASPVTGTDVGMSNPLITISTGVTCTVQGANLTAGVTAKLVGAW